jgi:hypothetical protein
MYGGIEDASAGNKIQPTADVYSMKLHLSKCRRNCSSHRLNLIELHIFAHL